MGHRTEIDRGGVIQYFPGERRAMEIIPQKQIESKILVLRGKRVMLDNNLAIRLYRKWSGNAFKRIKQQESHTGQYPDHEDFYEAS